VNIRESLTNQNMPISKSSVLKNLQKVAKLAPSQIPTKPKAQKSLMETINESISDPQNIQELGQQTLRSYVQKASDRLSAGAGPTHAADTRKLMAASSHRSSAAAHNAVKDFSVADKHHERMKALMNMITSSFKNRTRRERNIQRAKSQISGKDVLESASDDTIFLSKKTLKEHLLNELSNRTLRSYRTKAKEQLPYLKRKSKQAIGRANRGGSKEWIDANVADYLKMKNKAERREIGIARATNQIKKGG
jgi:hypothetical protein